MLKASSEKITLKFKRPAGTSRGTLKTKNSWIIRVWDEEYPHIVGVGEASIIEDLSPDWNDHYLQVLDDVIKDINAVVISELANYPSIQFGVEAALLDLKNGGRQHYFSSPFTESNKGIRINGLIWMGDKDFMFEQIKTKLDSGFSCLKLKIGAIDFEAELDLLRFIRSKFSSETLELRVDANGAFEVKNALKKLQALNEFQLHSIEQPIKQGQWHEMYNLVCETPFPIALDEELIGINPINKKQELMDHINPHYIILKPSLLGGFQETDEWIEIAERANRGWWITSALESNIGLNAIAQYTAAKKSPMPQGLGTGQLFTNNTPSQLNIQGELLFCS